MISPSRTTGGADWFSAPLEGIQRGVSAMNAAADQLATGELDPAHMVAQEQAALMVRANAAMLRTSGRMLGTLLDTFA